MNYKEIFAQIKNQPLGRVYLLHGEESYALERARDAIVESALGGGLPELNHSVYEGDVTPGQVEEAAMALPFMAPMRVVEIRGHKALLAERAGAKGVADDFAAVFQNIPASSCVIFLNPGEVKGQNPLLKAIAACGAVYRIDHLSREDALPYILRFAKECGCSISAANAGFLYDFTGAGLEHIRHEMQKLCAVVQGEITRQSITDFGTQSIEWRIFALLDDIMDGKKEQAMAQLGAMLDAGEAPAGILALLERQFRYMSLLCAGEGADAIAKTFSAKPFVIKKAQKQAARLDVRLPSAFLQAAAQYDCATKQGKVNERGALELLILHTMERSTAIFSR